MSHVTGHVISPTVHVTASHKLSYFDSPVDALVGGDGAGSHGDDRRHALLMHKHAEPACPHTGSLFHAKWSVGIGLATAVDDEGYPRPFS